MYKVLLLILLLFGILLIIMEFIKTTYTCPTEKVIYKYIPKTFVQQQEEPVYVSDIFTSMFTQPDAWLGNTVDLDTRKRGNYNYFATHSDIFGYY